MVSGREYEGRVVDLYEKAGFEVYQPPLAKYREQDVFGLFDVLAFGHDHLEAVQVKSGRDAAGINDWFDKAAIYEEHLTDWRVAFIHRADGDWRVARTSPDGYQWVYDGRDSTTYENGPLLEVLRS